jgi:ribulose 1,5-bisphosphate synthetase/thiazole synthase
MSDAPPTSGATDVIPAAADELERKSLLADGATDAIPAADELERKNLLADDAEKGQIHTPLSAKKPLVRDLAWERKQHRRRACCGVLLWPIRRIMGLVMFVLLLSLWLVWLIIFPFVWVMCSCRKLGIPNREDAYPKGNYKPIGNPSNPLKKGDRPYRVAIIGAGWAGLCSAKHFMDKGVEVTVFESRDKLGGTWNADVAYHGLHIHTPMWMTEAEDFPHPEEVKRGEYLSAPELYSYLVEYATKFGVDKVLKFNVKVVKVCYDSKADQSQVEIITPSGELERFDGFDAVVYSSYSSNPHIPTWPKQDKYQGRILHTSELQTSMFDSIRLGRSTVLVVGGSKSAVDTINNFKDVGHTQLTWLSRSRYMFAHVHTLCHDRSCYGMARGFLSIGAMSVSILWPALCGLLLILLGAAKAPFGFTVNIHRLHFGFVTDSMIKRAAEAQRFEGEILEFYEKGVVLKDRSMLEADYVICATGHRTGIDKIVYEVDNHSVVFQPVESLFEGIVSPVMPRLFFAHSIVYAFGMKRATSLADHVMSMLIRYPDSSRIKNTFFNSRANNMLAGLNFDSSKPLTSAFLETYLMLIFTGVLSIPSLISHMIGLFMLCRLRALNLKHPKHH